MVVQCTPLLVELFHGDKVCSAFHRPRETSVQLLHAAVPFLIDAHRFDLQSLVDLFAARPTLAADLDAVQRIRVAIYEPAYSIIADPAKRSPTTRQSADHSLPYILAKTLLKARAAQARGEPLGWESLMLLPDDYSSAAIADPEIRRLIDRIEIVPGGPEYDEKYPEGIPTSVTIEHAALGALGGELAMFPLGHARSDAARTAAVVNLKFERLVSGVVDDPALLRQRMQVGGKSAAAVADLYAFLIRGVAT